MSAEILKFGPNDGPILPRSEGPQKSPNFKFERPDWTLFRSVGTLSQKAGVPAARLRRLVLKELTDNALDAGATVQVSDDECDRGVIYSVRDYGPGIDGSPADIARMFSINRPLVSSKLWRMPQRGALGNGLRVVAGAVAASQGWLRVTTRNQSMVLTPQEDGSTAVVSESTHFPVGTLIEIVFGPQIPDDDHALAWAHQAIAMAGGSAYILRGAFLVTPMHASRAPTAGSGKSFLWDIVAAIAIGQLMPVMSTGANVEETEKRLGAALMAGQPLISIDNISGELGGDALCQVIERPVVKIRILGRSEEVRIEARGTSTYATGNNFVVLGDLTRRVITVNLDPQMERPELRQFNFDPIERVLAGRGKYIAAALTIGRAYVVAGRPDRLPRLASFEDWSDLVRSSLVWLGKADVVDSMENARAEDPERGELSDLLEAWAKVMGREYGNRAKLNDVILKGSSMTRPGPQYDINNPVALEPTHPELYTALEALAFRSTGKRGQKPDARLLGNYLRKFKSKIVDGKRFAMEPDPKRGAVWWVEEIKAKPAPISSTKAVA